MTLLQALVYLAVEKSLSSALFFGELGRETEKLSQF